MDHEAIRKLYVAHLGELRRKPYSLAVDIEEAACRHVIEALDALEYRLIKAGEASRDRASMARDLAYRQI